MPVFCQATLEQSKLEEAKIAGVTITISFCWFFDESSPWNLTRICFVLDCSPPDKQEAKKVTKQWTARIKKIPTDATDTKQSTGAFSHFSSALLICSLFSNVQFPYDVVWKKRQNIKVIQLCPSNWWHNSKTQLDGQQSCKLPCFFFYSHSGIKHCSLYVVLRRKIGSTSPCLQ